MKASTTDRLMLGKHLPLGVAVSLDMCTTGEPLVYTHTLRAAKKDHPGATGAPKRKRQGIESALCTSRG